MFEFKLPDLGEGVHEGEILRWYVEEGARVELDAPLVEVETDKAAVTLPCPVAGVVRAHGGVPGTILKVGELIARLETDEAQAEAKPVPTPPPSLAASPAPSQTLAPSRQGPVPAAPATRRIARELGVDLRLVPGSGPAGRVGPEDVRAFVAARASEPASPSPTPASPPETPPARAALAAPFLPFLEIEPLPDFSSQGETTRVPLRSIRRRIAHKMVTSMTLVPHVAHMDEIDVTELEAWRQALKARLPAGGITLTAVVLRVLAGLLREHPRFNASLDPFAEEIVIKHFVNLGVATDTERGLVVPVIREADRKSILDLSAEVQRIAAEARAGTLPPEAFRGGTFSVTNIGALGGTGCVPAINYPEVAILGLARAQDRPVVRDGQIVIRRMLPVTLSFDHRVADGADAARFVNALAARLSDPWLLMAHL
jgi:pyruvate dehydrogenase E2 component (dihydrolipoamide acetyltransferase)